MVPTAIVLLRAAACLVPQAQRSEWLREWSAELAYVERSRWSGSAVTFSLGSFRDALAVRSQAEPSDWLLRDRLRERLGVPSNPLACLLLLTAYTILAALAMWASPAVRASVWESPVQAHVLIAAGALLLCPLAPGALYLGTQSLGTQHAQVRGLRGWCFLGAKLVILTVLVYFASFDMVPVISRAPMQPQLAFVLYILAYRWALKDQSRRCPVCLTVLTSPVPIGHPGRTLLDWYGVELVCVRGHGFLHEPELPAVSYSARRWVTLDMSWRELFR